MPLLLFTETMPDFNICVDGFLVADYDDSARCQECAAGVKCLPEGRQRDNCQKEGTDKRGRFLSRRLRRQRQVPGTCCRSEMSPRRKAEITARRKAQINVDGFLVADYDDSARCQERAAGVKCLPEGRQR
ncbi:hypothetical protein J6590_007503 [Homalodisca vitripennis]|nr:hypothetical protein J6590_007503 [Homalodisca vitripennis]